MSLNDHAIKKCSDAVELLLIEVLRFNKPTDKIIQHFFKSNRYGSKERKLIRDAIFLVVKHRIRLNNLLNEHFKEKESKKSDRLLARVAVFVSLNGKDRKIRHLDVLENKIVNEIAAKIFSSDHLSLSSTAAEIARHFSFPEWIVEKLMTRYGTQFSISILESTLSFDYIFFRVNTLKSSARRIFKAIEEQRIKISKSDLLPECVYVHKSCRPETLLEYKQGKFEIQDLGSQLVSRLMAPTQHSVVVDFCCGSGGKALALGALMKNSGRIYAVDISKKKLERLKQRVKRSGLTNIFPILIQTLNDENFLKNLVGKANYVLVDVPCSGLGTLRRNPDLKWRIDLAGLNYLVDQQKQILKVAASLCKLKGYLVYSTCSFLAEENEQVIYDFLEKKPNFKACDIKKVFHAQGIQFDDEDKLFCAASGTLNLHTHLTGSDGFFMARVQRSI